MAVGRQCVLENSLEYEAGKISKWKFALIRRAVDLLEQYSQHGCIVWRNVSHWGRHGLTEPCFLGIVEEYVSDLERKGRGIGTFYLYRTVAEEFLGYLQRSGFHDCSTLALKDVSNFILYLSGHYQSTSMRSTSSALRSFLAFIAERKFTPLDLTRAVPTSFASKTTAVPTITPEEEQKLLETVDRGTARGKRDYAIMLLALRIGLRPVDIVNLRFDDLKWQISTIKIIQQKTGHILILPLLPDVGNAIIDYLLHGRPSSSARYVFIRSRAPYTRLSSSLYGIVSSYMKNAGIRQNHGDRRGLHCCRHSLAARLLAVETPLSIISTILGHSNKDSTKTYLSTDLEHLRACALGLNGIEVTEGEFK